LIQLLLNVGKEEKNNIFFHFALHNYNGWTNQINYAFETITYNHFYEAYHFWIMLVLDIFMVYLGN
jgi:hypothetical protein